MLKGTAVQGINRIEDVARLIPADKAQLAIARVMAALGSQFDWNADTLDWVADAVRTFNRIGGLPTFIEQDDDAILFWQNL